MFSNKPYKVIPFNKLVEHNIGEKIDIAENVTSILLKEEGSFSFLAPFPTTFNQKFNVRQINGKFRYYNNGLIKTPTRYLYSLESGYILGSEGLIYDKKRRSFIDESAKEWLINLKDSKYLNALHFPPVLYLPGITLSCLTNGAEGGYYHFIHEVLPKIYFCKSTLPYVNYIIMNGWPAAWKINWLLQIGIDLKKIIWADHTSHYHCQQLLFTNRIIADQQAQEWSIKGLLSFCKIEINSLYRRKPKKVIWITRKNAKSRLIEWEEKILNLFPEIEAVEFSEMTVQSTVEILKAATHVIGAHGAGFSNLFLCDPETYVLELYQNLTSYKPCYPRVSFICKLKHHICAIDFTNENNTEFGLSFFKSVLETFLNTSRN